MRVLSLIFLVVFAGLVGYFAWVNSGDVTLRFLNWQMTVSLALLIGVVYLLGMLSGWSVLGILRRSVGRLERQ
jgi:hypothetical protein